MGSFVTNPTGTRARKPGGRCRNATQQRFDTLAAFGQSLTLTTAG